MRLYTSKCTERVFAFTHFNQSEINRPYASDIKQPITLRRNSYSKFIIYILTEQISYNGMFQPGQIAVCNIVSLLNWPILSMDITCKILFCYHENFGSRFHQPIYLSIYYLSPVLRLVEIKVVQTWPFFLYLTFHSKYLKQEELEHEYICIYPKCRR